MYAPIIYHGGVWLYFDQHCPKVQQPFKAVCRSFTFKTAIFTTYKQKLEIFFSSKWIAKLTWLAFLEKHNNLLICRVARDERENSRKLHKTERGPYDIFDYLFWLRILINCQVDRDQHMTHECSWRKHTTRKWRLWRFWLSLVVENKDKFLFCIRVYLVFVEAYLLRHVPIN